MLAPSSSPVPPSIIRLLSTGQDDSSSGGELSDASSLAHMLERKEMSKKSFKKAIRVPSHLAIASPTPIPPPPRSHFSVPIILMESSPPPHRERQPTLMRSMTFSEALSSAIDSPSSPQSSLGPLPQLPPRPKYTRAAGTSSEATPRSSYRAGRGFHGRMLDRSTSSSHSLKPPTIKRTVSGGSIPPSLRSRPNSRVSFLVLREDSETASPDKSWQISSLTPAPKVHEEFRSSSFPGFPWESPAGQVDESRRHTFPVDNKVAPAPRPPVLARIRSAIMRYVTITEDVPSSSRSGPSRKTSADLGRSASTKSSPSGLNASTKKRSCIRSLFKKRCAHTMKTSSPAVPIFTYNRSATMAECSREFAPTRPHSGNELKRERSSISYQDVAGKHYVLPQEPGKRATWLPSEMTRINTPPSGHLVDGDKPLVLSRGFFFDISKPPEIEDDKARPSIKRPHAKPVPSSSPIPRTSYNSTITSTQTATMPGSRSFRKGVRHSSSYTNSEKATSSGIDFRRGSPDYFRQRILQTTDTPEEEEDVEMDFDIPDHLPNSPLCPKNATMYGLVVKEGPRGKKKVCPLHERGGNDGMTKSVSVDMSGTVKRKVRDFSLRDLL